MQRLEFGVLQPVVPRRPINLPIPALATEKSREDRAKIRPGSSIPDDPAEVEERVRQLSPRCS